MDTVRDTPANSNLNSERVPPSPSSPTGSWRSDDGFFTPLPSASLCLSGPAQWRTASGVWRDAYDEAGDQDPDSLELDTVLSPVAPHDDFSTPLHTPTTPFSPFSAFDTQRTPPTKLQAALDENAALREELQRQDEQWRNHEEYLNAHIADVEAQLHSSTTRCTALEFENAKLRAAVARSSANETYIDSLEHELEKYTATPPRTRHPHRRRQSLLEMDMLKADASVSRAEVSGLTAENRVNALARKMKYEDVGTSTQACTCHKVQALIVKMGEDYDNFKAAAETAMERHRKNVLQVAEKLDSAIALWKTAHYALLDKEKVERELRLSVEKLETQLQIAAHDKQRLQFELQQQKEMHLRADIARVDAHEKQLEVFRTKERKYLAALKDANNAISRIHARQAEMDRFAAEQRAIRASLEAKYNLNGSSSSSRIALDGVRRKATETLANIPLAASADDLKSLQEPVSVKSAGAAARDTGAGAAHDTPHQTLAHFPGFLVLSFILVISLVLVLISSKVDS